MASMRRSIPKTFRELQDRYERMGPWPTDRQLMALEALMFVASQLAKPIKKRKPSAWQAFFSEGMKAGKTPQQMSEEWRRRKAVRSA